MKSELVRSLIEQGAIRENTEIEAYYFAPDIGGVPLARAYGIFKVTGAKAIKGELVFETVGVDGLRRRLGAEEVIRIDGMDPARFAANYGLHPDGSKIKQGARRGRKPKIRPA